MLELLESLTQEQRDGLLFLFALLCFVIFAVYLRHRENR